MKEKEKEVSANGNKVVWKGPKLGIVIVVGVLLVILLGMQVFASTNGYGNVFFMIKELITTGTLEGENEIFSDKEITLSYKSIDIAEGVKLQANKLEIKENESTLCLHITAVDSNKVLPLKYEIMSEGMSKTEVKGSEAVKGDFDERLTVKYAFSDNELMTLYVKDKDGNLLRELEINLNSHEIYVKGESEAEKISQIELKKYLNVFSELNSDYFSTNEDKAIWMADKILTEIASQGAGTMNVEQINETIKEFYGRKLSFVEDTDSRGNKIEVLDLKNAKAFDVYKGEETEYSNKVKIDNYKDGICLKIEDIKYENEIYTVKYIYILASFYDVDAERLEELPQYEATIKLKVNKDAKYSKYQIVELSKGTEVTEKVSAEVNETEKNLEGVWTDKREGEGFYHNGIIKITNQTADSIDFELSATNGRDVDHVNIGDVSGTAKKSGDEYVFEEKTADYESKITISLGDFEGTKAVVVREEYSNGVNPYAGHNVWFAGEYVKEANETKETKEANCEHTYEVVKNPGNDYHTTLDGEHDAICTQCGDNIKQKHNFGKWYTINNGTAWTLWCKDCMRYVYTTDYSVVENSGYEMNDPVTETPAQSEVNTKSEKYTSVTIIDSRLEYGPNYSIFYTNPAGEYRTAYGYCDEAGKISTDFYGKDGEYTLCLITKTDDTKEMIIPENTKCTITNREVNKKEFAGITATIENDSFEVGKEYDVFYVTPNGEYRNNKAMCNVAGKVVINAKGTTGVYKLGVIVGENNETIQPNGFSFEVDNFGNAK